MQLRAGLEVLWRRDGESQVGTDGRCGVIVTGLTAAEQRLLEHLRLSPAEEDLRRRARTLGVDPQRASEVFALLGRAGVLDPRPGPPQQPAGGTVDEAYWTRLLPDADGGALMDSRRRATVAVVGLDRVGIAIAVALAQAGVGTVLCEDRRPVTHSDLGHFHVRDLGRPRDAVARAVLAGAFPGTRTVGAGYAADGPRPDVAVTVFDRVADPVRLRPLVRDDVPHLPVVVGDVAVAVGPLVLPGKGPCTRCLDLHRTDEDPCWPAVATQLRLAPPPGAEAATAQVAAGLAARAVLALVDGREAETGLVTEVDALQQEPAVRRWEVHPQCGCVDVSPS